MDKPYCLSAKSVQRKNFSILTPDIVNLSHKIVVKFGEPTNVEKNLATVFQTFLKNRKRNEMTVMECSLSKIILFRFL
jgi:hypothetical protein